MSCMNEALANRLKHSLAHKFDDEEDLQEVLATLLREHPDDLFDFIAGEWEKFLMENVFPEDEEDQLESNEDPDIVEILILLCHSADGFNRAAFCFR
jgi:hypothetical protein